jgi:hypothetical protein
MNLEYLQPVQELNRAFLEFVQSRARRQLDCLGLPSAARVALRAASAVQLDAVAQFPRALFRLVLEALGPREPAMRSPARQAGHDTAHHDLCLSILWAARHTSRHSPYQARLLFALEIAEVQRLRELPLPELHDLACSPVVLRCAFAEQAWLWRKLLTDARPEALHRLTLVALQPGVTGDWPQRRSAHSVA